MRHAATAKMFAAPVHVIQSSRPWHVLVGFLFFAFILLTGCAPVFSDLQSAKLVGKGKVETTASFSSVSFSVDGASEHVQDEFGIQAAYGVSEKTDLRFRFERIEVDGGFSDSFGVNVLSFGPKFELEKDRSAFYLPIGFAFGEEFIDVSETWSFHPTLLFSFSSGDHFEFTPSVKALVPLNDADVLFALNLGVGISTDLQKWALRPEFGFLTNPGEDGSFRQFSIGVTVYP